MSKWTFYAWPDYENLLARKGLVGLESVFAYSGGQHIEKPGLGNRERICIRLMDDKAVFRRFYLKRYRPTFPEQIRRILDRRSLLPTAWWDLACCDALERLGIGAPKPVAYGWETVGPFERRSFSITAEVPGKSLEKWILQADRAAVVKVAKKLGNMIRKFHRAGWRHRDLYLCHLFIHENDLALIDLARAFQPRLRKRRWAVKDLAALNYSAPRGCVNRRARLRFLRAYLGKDFPRLAPDWIRRIEAKTQRIARHDRQLTDNDT